MLTLKRLRIGLTINDMARFQNSLQVSDETALQCSRKVSTRSQK